MINIYKSRILRFLQIEKKKKTNLKIKLVEIKNHKKIHNVQNIGFFVFCKK